MKLLRRIFCCWLFGAHCRFKSDNPQMGIAGGGKCLDCGEIFPVIKWPKAPPVCPPHINEFVGYQPVIKDGLPSYPSRGCRELRAGIESLHLGYVCRQSDGMEGLVIGSNIGDANRDIQNGDEYIPSESDILIWFETVESVVILKNILEKMIMDKEKHAVGA